MDIKFQLSYQQQGIGTDVNLNEFSYTPWLDSLKDENGLCIYNHGVLKYITDGKTEEIIIPDGITEIGEFAFSNGLQNENIKRVKLPEGVKKIGMFAFSECRNMTEIYIPSTVKTIEYGAFDFCGELKFSGPGAQMAEYEKENGYPTAKAAEKAEVKGGIHGRLEKAKAEIKEKEADKVPKNKSKDLAAAL